MAEGTPIAGIPVTTGEGDAQGVEYVVLNDDVLTSVANATLVLLDGSDLERLAVLFQFPQFLEHCPNDTLQIMVPEICRDAVRWREDVQMAAAEALYFVVNMEVPEAVAKRICIASLRIIQNSESGDVFDAWGEILSMMLPQVRRSDVLALVVPATKDRALSDKVEFRRLAARIIGSLNDALTAEEVEEQFLDQALAICDDPDSSVRAMIAQSLASVGSKLPLRVAEFHLWPKLEKLMSDSNSRVRAAALRAIAKSGEAHRADSSTSKLYRTMLLPMFMKECVTAGKVAAQDLRTVDDDTYLMLEIFSEVYGYFLVAVSSLFNQDSDWVTALNALRRMVTCNGPTVRHWCAFNLPAVAHVCGNLKPERIKGVIQALSTDSDVETRATLASGIHETTAILAKGVLREEVLRAVGELMTDQNNQVRMHALTHFANLLDLLRGEDGTAANELSPIFDNLEMISQESWRTQQLLAEQLKLAAKMIPPETLCMHVAPVLFLMARESTYLVRKASISALISVVRYIPDARRRDHILKHFRQEWARGKVYWTRLAYVDGCQEATMIFSRKLFRQLFAEELLLMVNDPVPNVRLRLASVYPDIIGSCKDLPGFNSNITQLMEDKDPQVRSAAVDASQLVLKWTGTTAEEEKLDVEKEQAENAFFVVKAKGGKKEQRDDSTKEASNMNLKLGEGRTGAMPGRAVSFSNSNPAAAAGATRPTVVTHSVLSGRGNWEGNANQAANEDQDSSVMADQASSVDEQGGAKVSLQSEDDKPKRKRMCGCFG
uniref:Condensin complex subunit 1 C-terminal domain-containing protein n=1 Tax=Compsopogon caeruleus TaxID=31354 RepID=A0A7S1TGX7_9RHOD|mmetsp:Transcript_701/g.1461  ORF Transcript_701/g.1461 Transcript_701/m.1461 type:complete len:776 (+) Transcript_701:44-2371(+)